MSMHPTRNYFAEFKGENKIFIETGSFHGDGIKLALDAGYEHIRSCDTDPGNIVFCIDRFGLINDPDMYKKIHLTAGESEEFLAFNLPVVPATIWLDAHWQMLEGTPPGINPFPLLDELKAIKKYGRNDNTILIDDMLIMQYDLVGYSKKEIEATLLDINPLYKIEYLPNPIINGILIAHL